MKPLFIVAGASGTGKSTLVRNAGLRRAVSYTTRPMRQGEVDGVDYRFVTREQFNRTAMCEVTSYCGHLYGTGEAELAQSDVIICDVPGIQHFLDICARNGRPCYVIGLYADDKVGLRARLLRRGDDPASVERRLIHDQEAYQNLQAYCDAYICTDQELPVGIFTTIQKE